MSTNTVDRERVRREGEDKVLIKEVLWERTADVEDESVVLKIYYIHITNITQ